MTSSKEAFCPAQTLLQKPMEFTGLSALQCELILGKWALAIAGLYVEARMFCISLPLHLMSPNVLQNTDYFISRGDAMSFEKEMSTQPDPLRLKK